MPGNTAFSTYQFAKMKKKSPSPESMRCQSRTNYFHRTSLFPWPIFNLDTKWIHRKWEAELFKHLYRGYVYAHQIHRSILRLSPKWKAMGNCAQA